MWNEILKQQINLIRNETKIIKGKIKSKNKANLLASQIKKNKEYQILDWKINVILSKGKTTIIIKENNLKKNSILKIWDIELNNLIKKYKYNFEGVKENNKLKKIYINKLKIRIKYKITKIKKIVIKKSLKKKLYKLYWKWLIIKWNKIYLNNLKLQTKKQKKNIIKNKETIKDLIWKNRKENQKINFLETKKIKIKRGRS